MDTQEIGFGKRALHITDTNGLHICHMMPTPGPMTKPFSQGSLDQALRGIPLSINIPNLLIASVHFDADLRPLNETHAVFPNGTIKVHSINPKCSPYHETTAYSIPGFSYVKKLIAWTIETIISVVSNTIFELTTDIFQSLVMANNNIRLFETLFIGGTLLWHYQEPYRAIIAIVVYLSIFGVAR